MPSIPFPPRNSPREMRVKIVRVYKTVLYTEMRLIASGIGVV
jgi:hypothetical protein